MKVKDLIEKLSKIEPDTEVYLCNENFISPESPFYEPDFVLVWRDGKLIIDEFELSGDISFEDVYNYLQQYRTGDKQ